VTNDEEDERDAEDFFYDLETAIRRVPAKNTLLLGGDFNARVPFVAHDKVSWREEACVPPD
jgi:hypothetical protein